MFSAMFHHFHDDKKFLNFNGSGSISADAFNSVCDYLDQNFNLLSADEFSEKVEKNKVNNGDVCLTFDDNLKSQFDIVYPELQKRNLSAFFFVYSSPYSDNPSLIEFFRDFRFNFFKSLDDYYDLFFESVRLKYSKEYSFYLKNYKSTYLAEYPFYSDNDRKYRFLRDVVLKNNYSGVVLRLMEEKKYSISQNVNKLFFSIDNIKKLHESGHVIGLHSHSHPTRTESMNYTDQLAEYSKNYDFLSSITNDRIKSMAHPCGMYNEDTLKILKKLGITVGFRDSMVPSSIKSSLEIPRENHSNILLEMSK